MTSNPFLFISRGISCGITYSNDTSQTALPGRSGAMKTTDSCNRSYKLHHSLHQCLVSAGLHAHSGRDRLDKPDCEWRYMLLDSRAGSLCLSCFASGLENRLEIFFTGDGWPSVCVWWGGVAWRKENAKRRRVIKPLIKFNSLAIYIGVGFAAVGRNALAKGKSIYDLIKLEGELTTWAEMVLVYTFFFFLRNYFLFQERLSNLQV